MPLLLNLYLEYGLSAGTVNVKVTLALALTDTLLPPDEQGMS
jgi:hypothetical protein